MKSHDLANALLANANIEVSDALAGRVLTAKPKGGLCWCGCGGTTKSRFIPGHDSRFHALAKQVARGQAEMPTEFVCEEARLDFLKHHDAEKPLHEARLAEAAAKAEEKAAKKAEREAAAAAKKAKAAEAAEEATEEGDESETEDAEASEPALA